MSYDSSRGCFAEINGVSIYHEIMGSGPALVLLHAGICDSRMWEPQIQALTERHRVVRYDRRGFGKTEPVPGTFSHIADLKALLDVLGIERAHLVGCSQGGTIALDSALQHPEMVTSLTLVAAAPSGYKTGAAPADGWEEIDAAERAGDFTLVSELEVRMWVDGPSRTPDMVDPSIRDLVREMNRIALVHDAAEIGEEEQSSPALERLGEIHVPTLVIVGDLDQPGMVAAGDLLVSRISGAKKIVIPDVAHLPTMERPAELNSVLLDFLNLHSTNPTKS